jgi:CheY-like chemotaxis protein
MIRILFVDDERHVLRGLQRALSDLEDEWEPDFVESGNDALALMAREPFDA